MLRFTRSTAADAPAPDPGLSSADRFGGTSRWIDLDGPLHVVDYGGSDVTGRTFVVVHGFGGSYLDFGVVAAHLRPMGRVLAVDLPSFGLSPAAGRSGDVAHDARLLVDLIRREVGGPVVLAGNSRGGLVSALTAARSPEYVEGVVLFGAALPALGIWPEPRAFARMAPAALPVLGPAFVKLSRSHAGADLMVSTFEDFCFADKSRVPADFREALHALQVARAGFHGNDRAVARAGRSTLRRIYTPGRYDRLLDRLAMPVLMLHGQQDRIVPVAAAERAAARRPHWTTHLLEGVGHTAQLEAPAISAAAIAAWLDDEPHDTASAPIKPTSEGEVA